MAVKSQLGPNLSENDRTDIQSQLQRKYEAALNQELVLPEMVPGLALLLACRTVSVLCQLCMSSQGNVLLFYGSVTKFDGMN